MKSQSQFKTVGILGRLKSAGIKQSLEALVHFLSQRKQEFVVETETSEILDNHTISVTSKEKLQDVCDLLIVVGGDGSFLHASRAVMDSEIPILGINRGSLGFLTDILPTEIHRIGDILEGKFKLEKRCMLSMQALNKNKIICQDDALNEVALIPGVIPQMIEFEIYIDKHFVCSINSDGLIVATPTGSTAYALSGGGPIIHPQLDAIVLVPMFPHSLSNRPIVIEGNQVIEIIVSPNNSGSPRISCDGQNFYEVPPNSEINIQKKQKHLHLIHPLDYNYYDTLRSKLHWGKKLDYSE